jgi:hypothetical protein
MAISEQSSGLAKLAVNTLLAKILGPTTQRCYFYLMKGRIPTSIETITDPARYRRADRLIFWNRNQIKLSENGQLTANASKAFQSGLATWFHFFRIDGTKIYQVIGTVGSLNTGKDIEFSNVNLVKDRSYSINSFGFALNKEFEDGQPEAPLPLYQIVIEPDTHTWTVTQTVSRITIVPSEAVWDVEQFISRITVIPSEANWEVAMS